MRRLLFVVLVGSGLSIAYVAWPLHTALQIRDALIAGDTTTLARKIEWDGVRQSLKASYSPALHASLKVDPTTPSTLWQRIKATVARRVASTAIDRYVTPEYLPVLLGYRRLLHGSSQPVAGRLEPPTALAGTLFADSVIDRFVSFWPRLRSAVFVSAGKLTVKVEDSNTPGRHYVGTLELRGYEWKLTALSIVGPGH